MFLSWILKTFTLICRLHSLNPCAKNDNTSLWSSYKIHKQLLYFLSPYQKKSFRIKNTYKQSSKNLTVFFLIRFSNYIREVVQDVEGPKSKKVNLHLKTNQELKTMIFLLFSCLIYNSWTDKMDGLHPTINGKERISAMRCAIRIGSSFWRYWALFWKNWYRLFHTTQPI